MLLCRLCVAPLNPLTRKQFTERRSTKVVARPPSYGHSSNPSARFFSTFFRSTMRPAGAKPEGYHVMSTEPRHAAYKEYQQALLGELFSRARVLQLPGPLHPRPLRLRLLAALRRDVDRLVFPRSAPERRYCTWPQCDGSLVLKMSLGSRTSAGPVRRVYRSTGTPRPHAQSTPLARFDRRYNPEAAACLFASVPAADGRRTRARAVHEARCEVDAREIPLCTRLSLAGDCLALAGSTGLRGAVPYHAVLDLTGTAGAGAGAGPNPDGPDVETDAEAQEAEECFGTLGEAAGAFGTLGSAAEEEAALPDPLLADCGPPVSPHYDVAPPRPLDAPLCELDTGLHSARDPVVHAVPARGVVWAAARPGTRVRGVSLQEGRRVHTLRASGPVGGVASLGEQLLVGTKGAICCWRQGTLEVDPSSPADADADADPESAQGDAKWHGGQPPDRTVPLPTNTPGALLSRLAAVPWAESAVCAVEEHSASWCAYDLTAGQATGLFLGHVGVVTCLALDGALPHVAVSGSTDWTAKVWDTRTRLPALTLASRYRVPVLAACPVLAGGIPYVFTAGLSESIACYDLRLAQPLYELSTGNNAVLDLAWHDAAQTLYAVCAPCRGEEDLEAVIESDSEDDESRRVRVARSQTLSQQPCFRQAWDAPRPLLVAYQFKDAPRPFSPP